MSFAILLALGISPLPASATLWEDVALPSDATLYSSQSSVTNTSAITMFVDNGNAFAIDTLSVSFDNFNTGLSVATPGPPQGLAPTAANPFVFSQSGSVQLKLSFAGATPGVLDDYSVSVAGSTTVIYFEIRNPGPPGPSTVPFTGRIDLEIVSGTLTSAATPNAKSIDLLGSNNQFSPPNVYAEGIVWALSQGQSQGNSGASPALTPVKYSGPEFSGLSAKPVAVGASSILEGKRLNEVSSITIGGKSATFTATATELKLDVPKDLAPGLYDLVINSSAGKLTQINAVRVQGPLTALSVTTVSEGRISSEQLHEHALIAAMQQPELTKARCIVNGPNLAQAKAQAERLCALVRASNKNIETTVVESRSTVKNNKVYARVSYGWN